MTTSAFTHPTPLLVSRLAPTLSPITRFNPPTCATTPPPYTETLRTAYKSAKAAYKSAKRAQLSQPQLTNLQTTYKQAKAAYKASKYPPTLLNSQTITSSTSRYPPTPLYTTPLTPTPTPTSVTPQQHQQSNVMVCGGPSCRRLGADAVASMLRLPAPQAKCMKRCGGVGPTLSINNQPQKVDFRKALSDALRNAVDDYQN